MCVCLCVCILALYTHGLHLPASYQCLDDDKRIRFVSCMITSWWCWCFIFSMFDEVDIKDRTGNEGREVGWRDRLVTTLWIKQCVRSHCVTRHYNKKQMSHFSSVSYILIVLTFSNNQHFKMCVFFQQRIKMRVNNGTLKDIRKNRKVQFTWSKNAPYNSYFSKK